MDLGLNGKVALVVGASKGIGFAVANALWSEGCIVHGVSRSAQPDSWSGASYFQCDLMADGSLPALIAWVNAFGAPDIIYHALGGSWGAARSISEPARRWAEVWRYNLGLAIDINNAFLLVMQEKRWGRIVHTSSDAVKNSIGNAPYASAKFALEGYVKVASKEFSRDNVILSAVSLGPIYKEGGYLYSRPEAETKSYFDHYLPTQRFGTVEEAAKVIAFMCSEHASFMAGAVVDVHGGSR